MRVPPGEGEAAVLVRELAAAPETPDPRGQAEAAAARLQERRLRREMRACDEALRRVQPGEPEYLRLMNEMNEIAQSLMNLGPLTRGR